MRTFKYDALKNKKWDSELLGLVAQIHEFKGKEEQYLKQKPAVLDKLVYVAKIHSTEASNKIEGIVTTNTRVRELCEDKTTPRNRDEEEIMGYRDVLNTIHENYEHIYIQPSYILQLHRDLYRYSEKSIGGRLKNTQNYVTETRADGTQVVRFKPLEPYATPDAVQAICDNYNFAIDNSIIDPLILIPIFITDFLCIHPFNDGNGRMSRLLTTLLLYQQGYVVGKYISIEKKIETNKAKYYDVLQQAGKKWHEGKNNPVPFIKYLLEIILAACRDFEDRLEMVEDKLPALEQVRKAVHEKLGKFTKHDIMELVPGIGKASVENSLKQLVEEKIIERKGKGKNTFYVRCKNANKR